jgi:hypothetical protein
MNDAERITRIEAELAQLRGLVRGMVGRNGIKVTPTGGNIVVELTPTASAEATAELPPVPRFGGPEFILKAVNNRLQWVVPDAPAAAPGPTLIRLIVTMSAAVLDDIRIRMGGVTIYDPQAIYYPDPRVVSMDASEIALLGAPITKGTQVQIDSVETELSGAYQLRPWTAQQIMSDGTVYEFTGGSTVSVSGGDTSLPTPIYHSNGSFILK